MFWWPKATLLGVAILDDLRQTNSHPKMITVFYTYIDNWKWHQVSSSFVSANCKPFLFKSTNQPLRLQTYWRQDGGIPTHLTCCRFEVQALHPTCEQSLTRLSLYSYHAVSRTRNTELYPQAMEAVNIQSLRQFHHHPLLGKYKKPETHLSYSTYRNDRPCQTSQL